MLFDLGQDTIAEQFVQMQHQYVPVLDSVDGDQHLPVVAAEDEDDDADVDVPWPHVLANVGLAKTIGMLVFYI